MLPRYRHRLWLLSLLCIAVLVMRVGGAHLHLCFDGSEPPASLHFEDAGHHPDHHVAHDDVDVSLLADALTKTGKLGLDLPLLLLAAFCLSFLLRASPQAFRRRAALDLRPPPAHLRPLLRGPPAFAS